MFLQTIPFCSVELFLFEHRKLGLQIVVFDLSIPVEAIIQLEASEVMLGNMVYTSQVDVQIDYFYEESSWSIIAAILQTNHEVALPCDCLSLRDCMQRGMPDHVVFDLQTTHVEETVGEYMEVVICNSSESCRAEESGSSS